MNSSKMVLVVVSLAALSAAGCSSTRLSSLSTTPAPLTPAPSGTVTTNQLPPPAAPGVTDPSAFPPAPGSDGTNVASLPSTTGQAPAGAADLNKSSLVGSWSTSVGGASCQMFLTLTKYGNASRGGTRGCSGEMTNMRSWDVQGKQVVLFTEGGDTLARLYSSGGTRFDGQTTSGLPISLSR